MCRLFGFRSVIQSQVHQSLVSAENALLVQSEKHPEGWGVAYYVAEAPHVIKSVQTAVNDKLFRQVSGVVSSQTVIAHLRRATIGELSIVNTHPFQFGSWTFAHNGNIKNFSEVAPRLKEEISPELQRFILGETDSELIFYLILTELAKTVPLHEKSCSIDALSSACRRALDKITSATGGYCENDQADPDENTFLSFIISNGQAILAHHGGKTLYYSTYKNLCSVKSTCPAYAEECEAPTKTGFVNHLLFSSEQLEGENIWLPMSSGQMIGVDGHMWLRQYD